jgi:hypothetical protein
MGAPGIEAGTLATTVVHYRPLSSTGTARLQGFQAFLFHSVQPWPPTYMPPVSHLYKCPGGQL